MRDQNRETGERITELERSNAVLRSQLADLERRVPPIRRIAAPIIDPVTVISRPTAAAGMLTKAELKSLAEIVLAKFTKLGPAPDDVEAVWKWESLFENAVRAVRLFWRLDGLNTERYIGGWIDAAEILLHEGGHSTDLSAQTFTAAILAAGDVPHNFPNDHAKGEVAMFGLTAPGTGRPSSEESWRRVLRDKALLPRKQLPKSDRASAPQPRIVEAI